FLQVLRCFTSPRSLHTPYTFRRGWPGMTPTGFPHSDTLGSQLVCQLPEAYRRLQRPSSAPGAKASTECSSQLHNTKNHKNQRCSRPLYSSQATDDPTQHAHQPADAPEGPHPTTNKPVRCPGAQQCAPTTTQAPQHRAHPAAGK